MPQARQNKPPKYKPVEDNRRKHGVEIEFISPHSHEDSAAKLNQLTGLACSYEGYTHRRTTYWKIVSDSSVVPNTGQARRHMSGMELVSPPLTFPQMWEELRVMCDALNQMGAQINKNCGMHVHHHAAKELNGPLGGVYAGRLIDAYCEYEDIFDMLVPASRRESQG